MAKNLYDALAERRKVLLLQLASERVRSNPHKLKRVAHELREIALKLDTFEK